MHVSPSYGNKARPYTSSFVVFIMAKRASRFLCTVSSSDAAYMLAAPYMHNEYPIATWTSGLRRLQEHAGHRNYMDISLGI